MSWYLTAFPPRPDPRPLLLRADLRPGRKHGTYNPREAVRFDTEADARAFALTWQWPGARLQRAWDGGPTWRPLGAAWVYPDLTTVFALAADEGEG